MRTTAKLKRIGMFVRFGQAHRNNADFIAVFFAKQRHRTQFNRLVRGHQTGGDFAVFANQTVDVEFDHSGFFGGDRFRMRYVETQAILGH